MHILVIKEILFLEIESNDLLKEIKKKNKIISNANALKSLYISKYVRSKSIFDKKMKNLEKKLKWQKMENLRLLNIINNFRKMFNDEQFKMISKDKSKTHWKAQTMAKSIQIISQSSKVYNSLRNDWKLPIPAPSTIYS